MKKQPGLIDERQLFREPGVALSNSNSSTASTDARELSPASPDSVSSQQIQEMATNIEMEGDIEAEDMAQRASDGDVVKQSMVKNIKGKNIKLGNLTQES